MNNFKKINPLAYIDLFNSDPWEYSLRLASAEEYECFYAPMDYVNQSAKVVIVGITPGVTQAKMAYEMAKTCLFQGKSIDESLIQAKSYASFGGTMRKNLVRLLDHIGLNERFKLSSTSELFLESCSLCHFTSALRYPILKNGEMLSSAKPALKNVMLNQLLTDCFFEEIKLLPNALYLPLGKGVEEVLLAAVNKGLLKEHQLLGGLPHPSGANAERIKYFLGEKPKEILSIKTNASKIDLAKERLINKVAAFI